MTTTIDKRTAVSCQKVSDKNQSGIMLISGDMYTHTHTHSVHSKCVYSYLVLLLGLGLLIVHMRIEALINERGATLTCYVNGAVNMRAGCI